MLPLHHDPGTDPRPAFSIVVWSLRISHSVARGGVEPPPPPYQSDMLPLQHRAANRGGGNRTALSRAPATTANRGGARRVAITLHPVKSERPDSNQRSPGPPTNPARAGSVPADFQALPRSAISSSSGNRTPSSAVKGQHPGPVDERAVRARCAPSGSGGARIHVSRSSAWRYTVSATDPLKLDEKSPMSL